MHRVLMVAVTTLLGLLLMGSNTFRPMPSACGGFTLHDDDPCCVSGTVTLEGVPLRGVKVFAANLTGHGEAVDVTDYATKSDLDPTYGFLLDGPELHAEPGDEVTLQAIYEGYVRTVSFTVQPGEQWLDIELAGIHSGEQLRALPGD